MNKEMMLNFYVVVAIFLILGVAGYLMNFGVGNTFWLSIYSVSLYAIITVSGKIKRGDGS